ncbi:MAG TPA: hypothetical protein VMA34_03875 [Terracidiphilus sp.]|nr:hypothetical protein [Terracidiphilus sp.]
MPSASVQMPAAIFSIVRNDSTSQVKIEYQSQGQWEQVQIDAKKDANIKGDQIRVSTDREDHATITVTLPVEGGKKYHLFWNSQAGMWDLGSVAQ